MAKLLKISSPKETAKTSSLERTKQSSKGLMLMQNSEARRWHRHSFFTLVTCQNIDHKIKEFELWHPANPDLTCLPTIVCCASHGLRIPRLCLYYLYSVQQHDSMNLYFFDTPEKCIFVQFFFMRMYSHLSGGRASSLKKYS